VKGISTVSQKRWCEAQNAERQYFSHRPNKKPVFNNEFYAQNFSIGAQFFIDKAVLEIGCSPLATIHGIDKARSKIGVEPLARDWALFYEKTTYHIEGIGEYLPLDDKSVDIVLCINVLDHVKSPSDVLREINRCLKEGGELVLWLQTYSTFILFRRLLGRIDTPHPHHFNDTDILSLLNDNGFEINYHHSRRASINSVISMIKSGLFVSGLKSLLANLFLGLHESSFICSNSQFCITGQNFSKTV
jgi:SAM-dependent methyltransferase